MKTWEGVIAVENTATEDGRMIRAGGLMWEDILIPLMADRVLGAGAEFGQTPIGAVQIGGIQRDGHLIRARGQVSDSTPSGEHAVAVFVDAVQTRVEEGVVVFEMGRLRSIQVGTATPVWPECKITVRDA